MGYYTHEHWKNRISTRTDMSTYLTHLTKQTDDMTTLDVLLKILDDKKLTGSTNSGFIQGSDKAVCFQDAPPTGIAQNVLHEQNLRAANQNIKLRYQSVGLMFQKFYAFNKGARPVIYETKEVARQIYKNDLWRVVTLDLSDKENVVDWTHEREWRVKGDFEFELEEVTIIIPNGIFYKNFMDKVNSEVLKKIRGIVHMGPVIF